MAAEHRLSVLRSNSTDSTRAALPPPIHSAEPESPPATAELHLPLSRGHHRYIQLSGDRSGDQRLPMLPEKINLELEGPKQPVCDVVNFVPGLLGLHLHFHGCIRNHQVLQVVGANLQCLASVRSDRGLNLIPRPRTSQANPDEFGVSAMELHSVQ